MRVITGHQTSTADKELTITVADSPGPEGSNHRYEIAGPEFGKNPSCTAGDVFPDDILVILFQNGPIPANGVNGITIEALLAICADRLRCFQAGVFASDDNAMALAHITDASRFLQKRTLERMRRGVEGSLNI